jgi:hypothetical protein
MWDPTGVDPAIIPSTVVSLMAPLWRRDHVPGLCGRLLPQSQRPWLHCDSRLIVGEVRGAELSWLQRDQLRPGRPFGPRDCPRSLRPWLRCDDALVKARARYEALSTVDTSAAPLRPEPDYVCCCQAVAVHRHHIRGPMVTPRCALVGGCRDAPVHAHDVPGPVVTTSRRSQTRRARQLFMVMTSVALLRPRRRDGRAASRNSCPR